MSNDAIHLDPSRRHDFVLLFDVKDGNPNGDPDAGNLPRVDPETMQGLVSDVCVKRKIRDFIHAAHSDEDGYEIYVKHRGILNAQHQRAYDATDNESTGSKQDSDTIEEVRSWMCKTFYDVRTFGAVMTTTVNCGAVRGPVQLTFARSVDPIVPMDVSITRVAVTKEEDAVHLVEDESGNAGAAGKETEMGRKAVVPYGLYLGHGFVNPHLAGKTGFGKEDLEVLWDALQRMWDLDRSASRGFMSCRGLHVFTHDSPLGNAPANKLFDLLTVEKRSNDAVPRSIDAYDVELDEDALPDGVVHTALLD